MVLPKRLAAYKVFRHTSDNGR